MTQKLTRSQKMRWGAAGAAIVALLLIRHCVPDNNCKVEGRNGQPTITYKDGETKVTETCPDGTEKTKVACNDGKATTTSTPCNCSGEGLKHREHKVTETCPDGTEKTRLTCNDGTTTTTSTPCASGGGKEGSVPPGGVDPEKRCAPFRAAATLAFNKVLTQAKNMIAGLASKQITEPGTIAAAGIAGVALSNRVEDVWVHGTVSGTPKGSQVSVRLSFAPFGVSMVNFNPRDGPGCTQTDKDNCAPADDIASKIVKLLPPISFDCNAFVHKKPFAPEKK